MTLQFEIEKRGFPIKIGKLEFFFGTTPEELTRFFEIQEQIEEQANELQESVKHLKTETKEDAVNVVEITKQLAKMQYDALLGDGTFERIYHLYPDAEQLLELFDPIAFEVANSIEKEMNVRNDKMNKRKSELLKKKAMKKK